VLRADGDARRASRRILHRYRDSGDARGGDVVGAARQRLCQPVVLGMAGRPDRRARHLARRLGVPGLGDCRVHGDPGRSRAIRCLGRLWARLQRHRPGLCAGSPRAVPLHRGIVAGADLAVRQHVRDGLRRLVRRRAIRSLRFLCAGVRSGRPVQRSEPAHHRVPRHTGRRGSGTYPRCSRPSCPDTAVRPPL